MTSASLRWSILPIAVVAAVGVVALLRAPGSGPFDRALDVLRDDASVATATDAGAAFTRVSVILQDGGEKCLDDAKSSCDQLFATAAYSRVAAVSLLSCTRRGLIQARAQLTDHLEKLDRGRTAVLPPVPQCAP